jgi:hypothetical protein
MTEEPPTPDPASIMPGDFKGKVAGLLLLFTLVLLVGPLIIFVLVFYVLGSIEDRVLPWLTVVFTPIGALGLLPIAAKLSEKAVAISSSHRRISLIIKIFVVSSIIWAPLGAAKIILETVRQVGG